MQGQAGDCHLVVLQHGLWGVPSHVSFVSEALQALGDTRKILVLNSDVNAEKATYDGIDILGDRLAQLIIQHCQRLRSGGLRRVAKISFVGYSLGGLICRYAIGKLVATGHLAPHHASSVPAASKQTQLCSQKTRRVSPDHTNQQEIIRNDSQTCLVRSDSMIAVNFVTFASPHLGCWQCPDGGVYRSAFNALLPYTLSRTGRQLVLADTFMHGRPLLEIMSDPQYAFHAGLAMFRKRVLLANTRHDATVPYTTSSISLQDPYKLEAGVPINRRYPCIVRPAAGREGELPELGTSSAISAPPQTAAVVRPCLHRNVLLHKPTKTKDPPEVAIPAGATACERMDIAHAASATSQGSMQHDFRQQSTCSNTISHRHDHADPSDSITSRDVSFVGDDITVSSVTTILPDGGRSLGLEQGVCPHNAVECETEHLHVLIKCIDSTCDIGQAAATDTSVKVQLLISSCSSTHTCMPPQNVLGQSDQMQQSLSSIISKTTASDTISHSSCTTSINDSHDQTTSACQRSMSTSETVAKLSELHHHDPFQLVHFTSDQQQETSPCQTTRSHSKHPRLPLNSQDFIPSQGIKTPEKHGCTSTRAGNTSTTPSSPHTRQHLQLRSPGRNASCRITSQRMVISTTTLGSTSGIEGTFVTPDRAFATSSAVDNKTPSCIAVLSPSRRRHFSPLQAQPVSPTCKTSEIKASEHSSQSPRSLVSAQGTITQGVTVHHSSTAQSWLWYRLAGMLAGRHLTYGAHKPKANHINSDDSAHVDGATVRTHSAGCLRKLLSGLSSILAWPAKSESGAAPDTSNTAALSTRGACKSATQPANSTWCGKIVGRQPGKKLHTDVVCESTRSAGNDDVMWQLMSQQPTKLVKTEGAQRLGLHTMFHHEGDHGTMGMGIMNLSRRVSTSGLPSSRSSSSSAPHIRRAHSLHDPSMIRKATNNGIAQSHGSVAALLFKELTGTINKTSSSASLRQDIHSSQRAGCLRHVDKNMTMLGARVHAVPTAPEASMLTRAWSWQRPANTGALPAAIPAGTPMLPTSPTPPPLNFSRSARLQGEVFVLLLPVLVALWCCMLLWLLVQSTQHYLHLLMRGRRTDNDWDMEWAGCDPQQIRSMSIPGSASTEPAAYEVISADPDVSDDISIMSRNTAFEVHADCSQPTNPSNSMSTDADGRTSSCKPGICTSTLSESEPIAMPGSTTWAQALQPIFPIITSSCLVTRLEACCCCCRQHRHSAAPEVHVSTGHASCPADRTTSKNPSDDRKLDIWFMLSDLWDEVVEWTQSTADDTSSFQSTSRWHSVQGSDPHSSRSMYRTFLSTGIAMFTALIGFIKVLVQFQRLHNASTKANVCSSASHTTIHDADAACASHGDVSASSSGTATATQNDDVHADYKRHGTEPRVLRRSHPQQAVIERMCESLNTGGMSWTRVDVDTHHYHAHAAIVVRSSKRFAATHGHIVEYAIRLMRDV